MLGRRGGFRLGEVHRAGFPRRCFHLFGLVPVCCRQLAEFVQAEDLGGFGTVGGGHRPKSGQLFCGECLGGTIRGR